MYGTPLFDMLQFIHEKIFLILIMAFYFTPIILLVLFVIFLCRYLFAKKKNKVAPGTFTDEDIEERKITLIAISIAAGVAVIVVGGIFVLLCMAVAHM